MRSRVHYLHLGIKEEGNAEYIHKLKTIVNLYNDNFVVYRVYSQENENSRHYLRNNDGCLIK